MSPRRSASAKEVGIALKDGVFTLTAPAYAVDITDTQIVIHRTPREQDQPWPPKWAAYYSAYGTPTPPESALVKKQFPADPSLPDTLALAELEKRAAQIEPKVCVGPERHAKPVGPSESDKVERRHITSRLPLSQSKQVMRHVEDIAKQRQPQPAAYCWTSTEVSKMLGKRAPIYAFNLALRQKDPLPVYRITGGKKHQKFGFQKDVTISWMRRNMPEDVVAAAIKERGKKRG